MALIGEMQYLTIGGNTYSLPVGGGGTVTSVAVSNATNGGLSISGSPISSSGTITIGHSNVLAAAQTTQAVYPITIDKNGHISGYGTAVTIPDISGKVNITETNDGITSSIVRTDDYLEITANDNNYSTGISIGPEEIFFKTNTSDTEWIDYPSLYLCGFEHTFNFSGGNIIFWPYSEGSEYYYEITGNLQSSNRTITLPDKAGTVALTSDIPDISGKIDTAGTGLSKSGTTLNHSNSVTAQTTQAIYPIKIDAQGHISEYGSAVTIPSAVTNAYSSSPKTGDLMMYTNHNISSTVSSTSTSGALTFSSSAELQIGKAHSDDGSQGTIKLSNTANSNKAYTTIVPSGTESRTITLPNATGTVALTSDIPTVPTKTSDLTNDSGFITNAGVTSITTSAGAHSTKNSATGAVSFNVPTKTSHLTNDSGFINSIKTINNQSLIGSGDIEIQSGAGVFVAEYGVTPYADIHDAILDGQSVICTMLDDDLMITFVLADYDFDYGIIDFSVLAHSMGRYIYVDSNEEWGGTVFTMATTDTATTSLAGLMSASDKTKLNGIASGAEVNVQSNWSQSDSTADDYIKNKPDVTMWGGVTLDKTNMITDAIIYVPYLASSTGTTANITSATSTPTQGRIAKYDVSAYLKSTTPAANDNSTKVATTAYVNNALSGTIDSTSTPTANKIAKFDSTAHMNSTDMTSAEVSSFVGTLGYTFNLINMFYPVGSYYETSDTSFNPNITWGGTWVLETEGQVHVSAGENYEVGDTGGEATHTLTIDEMPSHNHNTNVYRNGTQYGWHTNSTGSTTTYNQISSQGGSQPHNNMPPYIVVNRWHRTA